MALLPGNTNPANIKMFDRQGRLIRELNATEEVATLNLSGLARGLYLLRISGKDIREVKKNTDRIGYRTYTILRDVNS
jgi:hypothetical protein